ncbi:MAG: chromosome segregation protein SMC, partial [Methylobacteriaceae bacterium]|nr:chromosome segregation protein SMC [Methylobacteriaceae bacterium]
AQRKLDLDTREVAERTLKQAANARAAAIAAEALPPLRESEARAGAALQRLVLARDALDAEEKRAKEQAVELDHRVTQLRETLAREAALIEDADTMLARLAGEDEALAGESAFAATVEEAARLRLQEAETALAGSEKALQDAQASLADVRARREALDRTIAEETQRIARLDAEYDRVGRERAAIAEGGGLDIEAAALTAGLERALAATKEAEARALDAERRHVAARTAEAETREPLAEAERAAQRVETEARTLRQLLGEGTSGTWPKAVDEIAVAKGYELALGAALGDDLDAAVNPAAPAHWALVATDPEDPALPPGVTALAAFVEAPAPLRRRLSQIGLVARDEGSDLRKLLRPGQRLVSIEGDLWRWDGLTAAAEAPRPAARRLAQRNRLGDLAAAAQDAQRALAERQQTAHDAATKLQAAAAAEADARQEARSAARAVEEVRERTDAEERRRAQTAARLSALEEAQLRLSDARSEASGKLAAARDGQAELAAAAELAARFEAARLVVMQDRAAVAEARAAAQGLARDADVRQRRRRTVAGERQSWIDRRARAGDQVATIEARLAEAVAARAVLDEAPDKFLRQRRTLMGEIDDVQASHRSAADRRAAAETTLAAADRAAREALDAMAKAREERAGSEARLDAAGQRRADLARTIAADLDCQPDDLAALAGVKAGAALPEPAEAERTLERLRQERERLGAVNLRAEEELTEVEITRDKLAGERDDLTEAVKRLRQAIQNLNREGRERLLTAFEAVNGHFKELFATLFGGGSAELQLVESDDPLEAGLEISARPPGKKPATMTLLSGGEQALTALALIFAVFLTNPSPICVLDEADAPLDDANVERFCDLLDAMRKRTDTRFVTITHNPITMARMDRLFGVTMAERGVSQLVSVDLQSAEGFREAG